MRKVGNQGTKNNLFLIMTLFIYCSSLIKTTSSYQFIFRRGGILFPYTSSSSSSSTYRYSKSLPQRIKSSFSTSILREEQSKHSQSKSATAMMMMKDPITPSSSSSLSSSPRTINLKDLNLKALKHEINKQYLKSIKKVSKLYEKIEEEKEKTEKKPSIQAEDEPVKGGFEEKKKEEEEAEEGEERESNNSTKKLEKDLELWQIRSEKLRQIDEGLGVIKNNKDERLLVIIPILEELQISMKTILKDQNQKNSTSSSSSSSSSTSQHTPRKPYFIYRSSDGIEIYVGRRAEDNDELSCNPIHRDDNEWWLHVSEHAGSHVVIKSIDDKLPMNYRNTILDAAVLAAMNSKANPNSKVTVSLTRCKNVSKPKSAKPGLVQIRGDIRSIQIDLKNEKFRLEKLEKIG